MKKKVTFPILTGSIFISTVKYCQVQISSEIKLLNKEFAVWESNLKLPRRLLERAALVLGDWYDECCVEDWYTLLFEVGDDNDDDDDEDGKFDCLCELLLLLLLLLLLFK